MDSTEAATVANLNDVAHRYVPGEVRQRVVFLNPGEGGNDYQRWH